MPPQPAASPAARCFRADLRRLWPPRAVQIAVIAYAAILAVQWATAVYAPTLLRSSNPSAQRVLQYALAALDALGLVSPVPAVLAQAPLLPPAFRGLIVVRYLALSAAAGAFTFLMPAFAARSIAPERGRGRVTELLREGLTPRQLLRAKGLAAVLPFLILAVVALAGGAAVYPLLFPRPAGPGPLGYLPTADLPEPWVLALGLAALPVTWALQCGIQVCLSALCRRLVQALLVCYVVQLAIFPLAGRVFADLAARTGAFQYLYAVIAPVITWGIVFALLQKLAVRALPGADGPPGTVPFRGRRTPHPNGKVRRRSGGTRRGR